MLGADMAAAVDVLQAVTSTVGATPGAPSPEPWAIGGTILIVDDVAGWKLVQPWQAALEERLSDRGSVGLNKDLICNAD